MQSATPSLMVQLARLREQEPRLYPCDAAHKLGVTECELVHADPNATPLNTRDWPALLSAIATLGTVMALARNEACVHELTGHYDNVEFDGKVGLAINPVIDLRFFLFHWAHAYAQQAPSGDGVRRSLQFFDRAGRAIQKVFVKDAAAAGAFDTLVARFACERTPLHIEALAPRELARPDAEVDVAAFQTQWLSLQDVHAFHPLLHRFGLTRQQAFRLAPPGQAWRVRTDAVEVLLRRAAAAVLPIMVFVGNRGVIQIHTGPVREIRIVGDWLNVLDGDFNLHLRTDLIAEAWVTHKPGDHGPVTSLELFDEAGDSLATFFGERKPGQSERVEWRKLLSQLPLQEDDDV